MRIHAIPCRIVHGFTTLLRSSRAREDKPHFEGVNVNTLIMA